MISGHTDYWRVDMIITPENLGRQLYELMFPKRDYLHLPESVRDSYELDALKLLTKWGASPKKP